MGAGASGSVIASRLTEDPDVSVAVLEAGEDYEEYPTSSIPLAAFALINSEADWAYETVPQEKSCQGMEGNVSPCTILFPW